jgi:hypothetical protein
MDASRMSRRSFIRASAQAGLLAAGAAGLGTAAWPEGGVASAAEPLITPPAQPTGYRGYVTRPDLRPPALSIQTAAGFPYSSLQPQYIFCAPRATGGGPYPTGAQPGLMILSLSGEVIWFQPLPATLLPFNFRVQTYKGNPVLTWFEGFNAGGVGYATSGHGVIANSSYQQIATVSASGYQIDLHELLLTSDGESEDTALVTAYQPGVAGPDGPLIVSHLLEVDIASGEPIFNWACYPAVPPSESYVATSGDYFHINSIDLWPGSARNLLISGRNTCATYLIDRSTKEILWRLGGKQSSFKMGAGVNFSYQHDARVLSDSSGISLFDDASPPSTETQSSGKVITLDQIKMRATLRHQYFHTDALVDTPREGNMQLLPNGGHLVGWGAAPYFSEFRASGNATHAELILDGRFPANVESYRTFMFDWVGDPPQDELRLVVRPTAGTGHFAAWVSWNGATNVDAWRLNAGPSAEALDVIATVKKRSFETAINFTRDGAKAFRIAALDARGNVITRSAVVTAT